MKEKRKGFTLIELLAVIVILAIIALIATPIVLKVIESARKGAFARSAEGVLKASKLYYTTSIINEVTPDTIKFNCNNIKCLSNEKDSNGNSIELDVDGNMGTGNVTITSEGKIELILGNGRYCAEKGKDETKIKVSKKICGEIIINKPQDLTISSKTGKAGEITVVGSVSNDDSEIKMYEFSIDNGLTWKKAENKTYTFTGLEIGKTYEILMRVTNMKDEQEQIKSDSITTSLIDDIEYEISNQNEWSISKTVTITGPKIDENIYKVIYSFDGENYQDYVEPIEFTENGAVKVDIVKKEDGTSILNKVITINVIKVAPTMPIISLEGVPNEIMVGSSYAIPTSVTDEKDIPSGIKEIKCIDGDNKVITDTKTLNIGDYTITCTVITGAGNSASETKTIIVKENRYTTGDALSLGGYNWHVISDDGKNLTLLMDANQLDEYNNMQHCADTNDGTNNCTFNGSYHVYSWDKSQIREYLNGEFLNGFDKSILNKIVEIPICPDSSRNDGEETYGGYLISELELLKKKCNAKQVSDKVRLISPSEYYYMSPYYSDDEIDASKYPKIENITRLSTSSNYASWLYCTSTACGNSSGKWWTTGSVSKKYISHVRYTNYISWNGGIDDDYGSYIFAVRPVITIVK